MDDLPASCQRYVALLERRLDGEEPSAEELAEARGHAERCSGCAALAGALALMATPVPLSRAEHAAHKRAALEAARQVERRRGWQRVAWALAASVAGLALGVLIWRGARPAEQTSPPRVLALSAAWCGKTSLRVGERLTPCQAAPLLELAEGTQMRLEARSVAKVLRADGVEQRLRLERGRLTLEVAAGQPRRFVVETPSCQATVVGTIFEVVADQGDARVAVVEGAVEVRSSRLKAPQRLAGGWQLSVASGQPRGLSVSRRAAILGALRRSKRVVDATIQAPRSDASAPPPAASPALPRARPPSVDQLLDRARRCRGAGDLRCARRAYLLLLRHHPKASVAITALVALAEVELDLGQPQAALAHCRRYLRLRPGGALQREARYAELRALQRLGRREAERRAIERFLARYPESIHADGLRARLARLRP